MHTTVIAEAGVNHNGDLSTACDLIDLAAKAGADIIKFQSFKADSLATPTAKMADYQIKNTGLQQTQHAMLKRLEMPIETMRVLKQHCIKKNIEFLSTAFDIGSMEELVSLGLQRVKIPSGEITNKPYLEYIGSLKLPTILSTGMSTMAEIEEAIDTLQNSGLSKENFTVLHCTTNYPALPYELNLRAIPQMRRRLKVKVGYSDHSHGATAALGAVALGATIIEKHITISNKMDGPDHAASMEPNDFINFVGFIRRLEVQLGSSKKFPNETEIENSLLVRKSVVARVAIRKGEKFHAKNLSVKRPGTGISPMRIDSVIGQTAKRDFEKDELVEIE